MNAHQIYRVISGSADSEGVWRNGSGWSYYGTPNVGGNRSLDHTVVERYGDRGSSLSKPSVQIVDKVKGHER